MPKNLYSTGLFRTIRTLMPATLVLIVIVTLGVFFHIRSKAILQEKIREQLKTAATIAALQFSPEELAQIRSPQDMRKPLYRVLNERLQQIRLGVPNGKFVYIFRRDDSTGGALSFVADADAALTQDELDRNHNGKIDPDEEAGYPGEKYDISDIPVLHGEAFLHPVVSDVYVDQWGKLLSGFAPIMSRNGHIDAVLGIDMDATEYSEIGESILSPIVLLLVFVVGILMTSYIGIFVWKRRLENMQILDRERSRLIDLTLHQVGTPLSGMRWWLEILRDETAKSETANMKDAFLQMNTSIERMTEIIEALGKASKIRRREIVLHPETLLLREAIDAILETYKTELAYREQIVTTDVDVSLEAHFDRVLLTEVLQALVKNAIYYSPYGSHIWISAHRDAEKVRVTIRDEGIGISAEELESIFNNQMRRGEDAMMQQPVGNGLGLYITKSIIERGGGEMWIESEKGRGTAVIFTIPSK